MARVELPSPWWTRRAARALRALQNRITLLGITNAKPNPGGISGEIGGYMKDTRLNIRMSSELKEQAQKLAEADGRDLTNWVTWLIRKEIEKAAEK
jgi:hypothetical protein